MPGRFILPGPISCLEWQEVTPLRTTSLVRCKNIKPAAQGSTPRFLACFEDGGSKGFKLCVGMGGGWDVKIQPLDPTPEPSLLERQGSAGQRGKGGGGERERGREGEGERGREREK